MSTDRSASTARQLWSRWGNLGLALALGVVLLVIGLARGNVYLGASGLVIMCVYAGALEVSRRRSEAAHLLSPGARNDERQQQIGVQALAMTGSVLTLVVVVGFFWTYATDSAASAVFGGLAALAGLTFIVSTFLFTRRC